MAKRLKSLGNNVGLDILPGKFNTPFDMNLNLDLAWNISKISPFCRTTTWVFTFCSGKLLSIRDFSNSIDNVGINIS